MDILTILNPIYNGTHSIQYWGSEWDGMYRCQDHEHHMAWNTSIKVMPSELVDGIATLTEEEFAAKSLGSLNFTSSLFDFERLSKSSQEVVIGIIAEIRDGMWIPSGLESDRVLAAMGYNPFYAKLAANLMDWTKFQP